jgi:hypothetical protein
MSVKRDSSQPEAQGKGSVPQKADVIGEAVGWFFQACDRRVQVYLAEAPCSSYRRCSAQPHLAGMRPRAAQTEEIPRSHWAAAPYS